MASAVKAMPATIQNHASPERADEPEGVLPEKVTGTNLPVVADLRSAEREGFTYVAGGCGGDTADCVGAEAGARSVWTRGPMRFTSDICDGGARE